MRLVRRADNLATFMCPGILKVFKACVGLYFSLKNPVIQIVMVDCEHCTKASSSTLFSSTYPI